MAVSSSDVDRTARHVRVSRAKMPCRVEATRVIAARADFPPEVGAHQLSIWLASSPVISGACAPRRSYPRMARPAANGSRHMTEHVYKKLELTGSSKQGFEDAIGNAIAKASKTIHNLRWFEVVDIRGEIEGGKAAYWQVTIKAGFTLDD
jgi:flavin-binding protein dodecin